MVLGRESRDGFPDLDALRAFRFDGGDGIALHLDTWHAFPRAIEPGTRLTVILSRASHFNTLLAPPYTLDARGPDLERSDIAARARIVLPGV